MGGEFHDVGLVLAVCLAVALALVVAYRIAIGRAHHRLHGRSTRYRERNLPVILRFDRRLGQALRGRRRRRRSRPRRDR